MLAGSWSTAVAQNLTVQGKVTAANNNSGLPGVTINVLGTSKGSVTDANGNYSLNGLAASDSLVFSYVGYDKKTVGVNGRARVDISLTQGASSLEQIVVIGYGTAQKKDLTGAVSSVNAEKLENEHPNSVQDVLRSNVPGLKVAYNTSAKGASDNDLEVRGKNTLNAGSNPLLVVDGVIYYGSMSDINPNDIATIDVLKDASSAAVYGAKSANGVILITTKRGKEGKPVINVNASFGLATMGVNQRPYSAQDFLKFRSNVQYNRYAGDAKPYEYSDPRTLPDDISMDEWLGYDGSSGDPVSVWLNRLNFKPIEIANYKAGKSIDWYDKVFQTGLRQDYTVSLSGRKDELSYYWSLGYTDNEGVVVGDEFSTVRSRINLEAKITKFLTVGTNTQFSYRDESQVPANWDNAIIASPWGSMYRDDDSTALRFSPNDQAIAQNPFGDPTYTDRMQRYYTLNSSIYGKVTLPFDITYQVNFTPRIEWYNFFQHQSADYIESNWATQGGIAARQERQIYQWQVDNLIKWSHTFNNIHHFDVTLLANAEKYQVWRNKISNNGFDPSDALGYHDIGSGINPVVGNTGDYNDETGANTTLGDEYSTGDALMARVFYSLKDRYMLTLSVRRDGYSAFGSSNPRATFPAAAFGWVFTEEPFFKADWLDFGKLRLSYGVNGNRDIPRYAALSIQQTGKYLHVTPDGKIVQVSQLYVNNMANPDLKWERTSAYNIGLDFSLFHSILDGSIDAYLSKTTNLLVQRALPDVIGFDYIWDNLGEVDNKGFEINLSSHNIDHPTFSWNTSANFSLNRNEIVHLYGNMVDITDANGKVIGQKEADDVGNKWFIGHAIDAVWDQNAVGIWQSDEANEAQKYGVSPGDFKVKDVNNDGQYTDADREFLGFTEPRFRWTLRNEFTFWKNISLSFVVYSIWGNIAAFNQAKNNSGFIDRSSYYDFPYWTADNPTNDYARLYSSNGSATYSVYRKKSFIRLDNVALAYTFPQKLLKRASIQGLKAYFTVKNAALYAPDWNFWDPEPSTSGPTPRIYTLGLNLTL
ncbi:TonB-dependent receptor [Compostibacter hankyongensis]|uniref:TonB-dependent receptor n=1 Tax=Compostibacter hankyongensis TaxID=1007089 RepID=A0ABP8FJ41_9BACT